METPLVVDVALEDVDMVALTSSAHAVFLVVDLQLMVQSIPLPICQLSKDHIILIID